MLSKVAVLGSGTMGAQIAAHLANAGVPVLLLDITIDQVQSALKALDKASPPALFVPAKIHQIEVGTVDKDLVKIKDADWVIEAIVEDPKIKAQLLERDDAASQPGSLVT